MATSRARVGRARTRQPDETRIAGERTCREWIGLSAQLDHEGQLPNNALDEDCAPRSSECVCTPGSSIHSML